MTKSFLLLPSHTDVRLLLPAHLFLLASIIHMSTLVHGGSIIGTCSCQSSGGLDWSESGTMLSQPWAADAGIAPV